LLGAVDLLCLGQRQSRKSKRVQGGEGSRWCGFLEGACDIIKQLKGKVLNEDVGNPAKSIEVNDLIKAVKEKKVRMQGKASPAQ
jgi:hypothetical protein